LPRSNIAAFDTTTGQPITSWAPNVDGEVAALAVSADGSKVYAGGSFTTVDGLARKRLVALNTITGAVDTTWKPSAGYTVKALLRFGSRVYIGGAFTTIGGMSRPRLAAVDATSGKLDATWVPSADDQVRTLAVSPDGSRAFVASPGQLAAIDLRTFGVSYHRLGAARRLQKGASEGKFRAVLVAGDRLLVTGSDYTTSVNSEGIPREEPHPVGLQLVDTRDWSVKTIDPATSAAVVSSNAIFATSVAWNPKLSRTVGGGATIYDLSGAKRAHIFKGQEIYAVALGSRAFVSRDGQRYTIVSTTTGRIVRTVNGSMPEPLVGSVQG
jgi:hypothetical protein